MYNGDTTCQERIKSKMAHPFRLAELARAAVTRGSGRKLLESSQGSSSSYSGEPWVEEIELFGLDGGDGALFIPAPLESNAHSSSRSVDRRKLIVGSNSTVYDINGQTVTVDTDMAGTSFTDDGSGLIDITQSNTKDAYTGDKLPTSAKLRIHADGYIEIIRNTFYVGDRARFFFIAGANCDRNCINVNCDGPIDISYNFQFTNGQDFSDKHFSADELGVMETMITFLCLQTLLVVYFMYVRKLLKTKVSDSRKIHIIALPHGTLKASRSADQSVTMPRQPSGPASSGGGAADSVGSGGEVMARLHTAARRSRRRSPG